MAASQACTTASSTSRATSTRRMEAHSAMASMLQAPAAAIETANTVARSWRRHRARPLTPLASGHDAATPVTRL